MNERDIVAEIEMAGRLGYSLQITEAEARRVTALLAERERMVAVVEAAETWWTMSEDVSMDEVIMICDTLEEALSAYRAQEAG